MIRATAALIVLLFSFSAEARAEAVDVKYRGPVDLKTFECHDINRSSFIQRVCYDKAQSYMIISLRGTYYHYCELPPGDARCPNGRAIDGPVLQSKHSLGLTGRLIAGRTKFHVIERDGRSGPLSPAAMQRLRLC